MAKKKDGFAEAVTIAAKEEGIELGKPDEIVEAMRAENPEAERKVVRDGQILVFYTLPHYRMIKDGGRVVEMAFSFPLQQEHRGFLPGDVEEAWDAIDHKARPMIAIGEIPLQTVTIRLAPDMKKKGPQDMYELHLVGAQVVKAMLKKVEEKGKGMARTVTRFSFRIVANAEGNDGSASSSEVRKFADTRFGREVWMELAESQRRLKT